MTTNNGLQTPLTGQATPEQIREWKEKHKGGIYAIKVGAHIAYFREPEIADMNVAMSQTTADTQLDYFKAIFRETKIGGSDEIISQPRLFMGFIEQIKVKIEGEKGELVNL